MEGILSTRTKNLPPLTVTFIAFFSSAISASMASSLTLEARALQDLQQEVSSTFTPPASTSSLSEETFAFGHFIAFLCSKLPLIPPSPRFEISALSSRGLSCQRHHPRRSRCPSCGRTPAPQRSCATEIFAKNITLKMIQYRSSMPLMTEKPVKRPMFPPI